MHPSSTKLGPAYPVGGYAKIVEQKKVASLAKYIWEIHWQIAASKVDDIQPVEKKVTTIKIKHLAVSK